MDKPYPNLKDYKRHKRSYQIGKNIRLSEKNLELADPNGLIRLANWLGVLPAKSNILFEKEWIQKVRCAIARKEKHLFGLPNQGRKEEKKMENRVELIKKLRVLTNAPMGDCISALQESNNDLDKAADWLKVKGLNSGGKVVEELTEERIEYFVTSNGGCKFILVRINCQTDFCARSKLVRDLSSAISLSAQSGVKDFSSTEREYSYKLGEVVKIKVHVEPVDDTTEHVAGYIHPNRKIGTLVKFNKVPANSSGLDDYDQNLCMQVAATNVLSISPEDLPADVVARQKAIFEEQVKLLKKPEAASVKILEGKMNKWYSEVCLLKQECVWEPKLSVEKYLKKQEEICGHPIVVKKFVKFSI